MGCATGRDLLSMPTGLHTRRRLFAGWRPALQFPEVIGKSAMPALDVTTTTPTRETAATPVEITCETAAGEEAQELILRLACALHEWQPERMMSARTLGKS